MSKIIRTVPRYPQGGTTYTDPSCIILPYNTPPPRQVFQGEGERFFEIFGQNLYKNIACDATTALFRKRHGLLNYYVMPAKNKTNLAKTPLFSRFLSNSRLKYVWYVCARLYQKSSKISTFWLLASLTEDFQAKTRHANGLILDV